LNQIGSRRAISFINLYSTELEHSSWIRDAKFSDNFVIFRLTSSNVEVIFKIML